MKRVVSGKKVISASLWAATLLFTGFVVFAAWTDSAALPSAINEGVPFNFFVAGRENFYLAAANKDSLGAVAEPNGFGSDSNFGSAPSYLKAGVESKRQGKFGILSDDDAILSKPQTIQDVVQKQTEAEFVPGELIVKLKPGSGLEKLNDLNRRYGVISSERLFKDTPSSLDNAKALGSQLNKLSSELQNWYVQWQLKKDPQEYNNYIVKIEQEIRDLDIRMRALGNLVVRLGARQKRVPKGTISPRLDNIYIFKAGELKDADLRQMANDYSNNPYVEYAEPTYLYKAFSASNDPYYSSSGSWGQSYDDLWGLKKIMSERAWDITKGKGVVVAVVDTGVQYAHEDLAANMWVNPGEVPGNGRDDDNNGYTDDIYGYDFAYDDGDPNDGHGHGTHCAGTIAATGDNFKGVVGVAPEAKIMAVKGLDDYGAGTQLDLAAALIYAADNGADIISNSWGGQGYSRAIEDAVNYAYSKGCVVVAAAGNSNADVSDFYPASLKNVISVAASTQRDEKCSFSNYGERIDVAAPGGGYENELGGGRGDVYNILSTMPNGSELGRNKPNLRVAGGYWRLAGTSMACPHVAGVAALVLSYNPTLTNNDVSQAIGSSADDIGIPGKDIYFGNGRVNAYKAVLVGRSGITAPANNSFIHGRADITGSTSVTNFQRYELYYAPKDAPESRQLISSSSVPVIDGLLGVWETGAGLTPDNLYIITLRIIAIDGIDFSYAREVMVDNTNQEPIFNFTPEAPVIGRLSEFKVTAKDLDDPATPWGRLSYSVANLPARANFNSATQIFSWTPAEADKGVYEITFTVRDSEYTTNKTVQLPTLYIEEREIGSSSLSSINMRLNPEIYENKVVWWDVVPGAVSVKLYDLLTGQKTELAPQSDPQHYYPHIWGDKVAWDDWNEGIQLYTISTARLQTIRPAIQNHSMETGETHEKWLVYPVAEGYGTNVKSIYLYDLSTGRETRITSDSNNNFEARVFGDKIIYASMPSGSNDVYLNLYDIATGQKSQIFPYSIQKYWDKFFLERVMDFHGNKIVWEDTRNGNSDIYVYDLQTQRETPITSDFYSQYGPAIYEDRIVWEDSGRTYNNHIYLYDLSTGVQAKISSSGTDEHVLPAVFKDTVAWSVVKDMNIFDMGIFVAKLYFAPQLSSVTPQTVSAGSTITLRGNNFGYSQETNAKVEFVNGAAAAVANWSNNEITCTVPSAAQSGLVSVVTLGGRSNGINITIASSPVPRPTAPSNLTATAVSTSQINLSWADNASNETGFKLERSLNASTGFVQIAAPGANVTSYQDTGLVASTTYYYKIKAANTAGDSGYSNTANATTLSQAPPTAPLAAPSNLIAVAVTGSNEVRLNWKDNSSAEAGFKVEVALSGGSFMEIYRVGANVENYSLTLSSGITVSFRVRAYNASGQNSEYSNTATVVVGSPFPPPVNNPPVLTPIGNKTVTSGSLLTFVISATDADNNPLIYSATGLPSGATFTSSSRTFSWTPTTSQVGTYQVTFNVSDGTASDSEAIVITVNTPAPVPQPPAAPGGLQATAISQTQINLSWNDTANESYFKIERSLSATGGFSQIATVNANITSYPNTGLTAGTTYYYKIKAVNANGESAYSNTANATTSSPTPPVGYSDVIMEDITWVPASVTRGSSVSFTVRIRNQGQVSTGPYSVEIAANDGSGYAAWYAIVDVPEGLASGSSRTITIPDTWVPPRAGTCAIAAGVIINEPDQSNNWFLKYLTVQEGSPVPPVNNPPVLTPIGNKTVTSGSLLTFVISATDADNNPLTYSATGLPSGATFTSSSRTFSWTPTTSQAGTYQVTFNVSDGTASDSEAIVITVNTPAPVPQPPAAPGGLQATAISQTQINLSWADNASNETGFKLERSLNASTGFVQIAAPGANVTSYQDTGLVASTTYYYKIKAANTAGDSGYSNMANATTITIANSIDLKVVNIKFYDELGQEITVIPANTMVILDASLINQGAISTGSSFRVKWYIDGVAVSSFVQPQLGPGQSAEMFMFCSYLWKTPTGGTVNVRFEADADSQIPESDEGNNSLNRNVSFG